MAANGFFSSIPIFRKENPDEEKARRASQDQDRAAHAANQAAQASRRAYGEDLIAYHEDVADQAMVALDPARREYLSAGDHKCIRDTLVVCLNNKSRPLAQQTEVYQQRRLSDTKLFAQAMAEELMPDSRLANIARDFRDALAVTEGLVKAAEEKVDPADDIKANTNAFRRSHYTGHETDAIMGFMRLKAAPGSRLNPNLIKAKTWGWRDPKGFDHTESRFELRNFQQPINTPVDGWLKGFPGEADIAKWDARETKDHLHEDIGDAADPYLDRDAENNKFEFGVGGRRY